VDMQRDQWSSRIGFIFAASGSAIGLGNIWRFPYIVGENGGAAFVLLYLLFVALIGLPYMYGELALGRFVHRNPVGAINAVKPGSHWKWVGILGVITGIGILSFYGVVAGWTFGYIFKTATHTPGDFSAFIAEPFQVIGLFALFLMITASIVYGGIEGGIERWSKVLMPVLFVLLIVLIIYANMLEGSENGLLFYLKPDFSKLTGKVALQALGQAFFSLSLGMGMMITYGSYLSKKENIIISGFFVGLFDTLIALMAGFIIFPALFAMGENPATGPALVFIVFPKLFTQMPGGEFIGVLFFILLAIAALTSTISLLEVPVTYIVDEKKYNRKNVVWPATMIVFIAGLPSVLSQGSVEFFTNFALFPKRLADPDFLTQMSFLWGSLALTVGALFLSIFIGWVWGTPKAIEEMKQNVHLNPLLLKLWAFLIRYFIPVVIFVILLNLFGLFD
jgi:NSS family neurotransmitter:Na+ symporter